MHVRCVCVRVCACVCECMLSVIKKDFAHNSLWTTKEYQVSPGGAPPTPTHVAYNIIPGSLELLQSQHL